MEPKINLTLPWCTVCLLVAAAHRAAGGTLAKINAAIIAGKKDQAP